MLTAVSAGQLVSIQLYGPGHYGASVQVSDGGTGQAAYTKGDLLVTPGGAALNRLPVGADGQALMADSASTNGVKWGNTGGPATCIIDNDSQSATALSAAQLTGRCEILFAAHIVEVGVWGGTGTGANLYAGRKFDATYTAPTEWRHDGVNPERRAGDTELGRILQQGLRDGDRRRHVHRWPTSSNSVTLAGGATVAINAGDVLYVSSATADGVQTWFTVTIILYGGLTCDNL